LGEFRDQRQGEEAVNNRGAEWSCSRSLLIHMDPLVVLGAVGECVNEWLLDRQPVTRAEFAPNRFCQFGERLECPHRFSLGVIGVQRPVKTTARFSKKSGQLPEHRSSLDSQTAPAPGASRISS